MHAPLHTPVSETFKAIMKLIHDETKTTLVKAAAQMKTQYDKKKKAAIEHCSTLQTCAEAMEALQMLKFSIRKGWGLNFMDELDEASQIEELEALLHQQMLVPKNMQAFIRSLTSHSIV
ncbi:uncharacterized protein ARMOST_03235 [Armillaria ostoyae]|uniref:Uncharacterized protein n=1 Tax=Armillaria ostoyae TaxID=47428 RepID=A0A284QTW3_ARMOS|nr:uncharacterized protein ARMOST_03235 [Armillaria ostoyae]